MSTVQEIEAAIQKLDASQRNQLVRDLPALLPELNGDQVWERIVNDPRPRPALTALLDDVELGMKRNPNSFPKIKDSDFNQ